jgi:hypothetical protein
LVAVRGNHLDEASVLVRHLYSRTVFLDALTSVSKPFLQYPLDGIEDDIAGNALSVGRPACEVAKLYQYVNVEILQAS